MVRRFGGVLGLMTGGCLVVLFWGLLLLLFVICVALVFGVVFGDFALGLQSFRLSYIYVGFCLLWVW